MRPISCNLSSSFQVDELRQKLEEKNKMIEKKTHAALSATQDKNRISNELGDLRDQVDIKDRKVNVLQRKVNDGCEMIAPSTRSIGGKVTQTSPRTNMQSKRFSGITFTVSLNIVS